MNEEQKERYQVKDGYTFLFVAETRDADGVIHKHRLGNPAPAGSIIEIRPSQALGQEQKLDRVDGLVLKCNNSGCFKEFMTKAFKLAYAWCPHCGGRGGKVVRAATDKDAKLNEKKETKKAKKKAKEPKKPKVETPKEEEADREEKGAQVGRETKAPKKTKKGSKKKKK
jgi:hypothetical protein